MSNIIKLLEPHVQDLGGFNARRSLPHKEHSMVGSFIFFDHLGPANFPPGRGVDVRPHPHINLATVTYVFEGALLHRDSLGYVQEIHPGAVNWMTAGKGIVHSERSLESDRNLATTLHAVQIWVALPEEAEDVEPSFVHYPAEDIPRWTENGVAIALIIGKLKGRESSVRSLSSTLYCDLALEPGSKLMLDADYSERAIYSITSGVLIDGQELPQHRMAIIASDSSIEISAQTKARCMVIGGEPVGKRYKWWNFVSSSKERIEQAKQDWQLGRFPRVPKENEFIPLPTDIPPIL
ncbi:MAG: pirin family protein [Cyanobacteria bacterium P01_G01_bin.19]